jgi:endonuclease/exonuclease/phosphatase (EEP) superfamily protein YafD
VQAKLLLQGRSLVFLGAHPPPPIGGHLSALRDAQLAALAEWTAGQDLPVLLAGDLNATP